MNTKKTIFLFIGLLTIFSAWAGPGKVIVKNSTENTCLNNGIRGRGSQTWLPQQVGREQVIEVPEQQCGQLLYLISGNRVSWIRVQPDQTVRVNLNDKKWSFSGDGKEVNRYLYGWTHTMYYGQPNGVTFMMNMMLHELPEELRRGPGPEHFSDPAYAAYLAGLRSQALRELERAGLKDAAFVQEQKERIDYVWLDILFNTEAMAGWQGIDFPVPPEVGTFRFDNASLLRYPERDRVLSGFISYCDKRGLISFGAADFLAKRAERFAHPEIREYYVLQELNSMLTGGKYQYLMDRVIASAEPFVLSESGKEQLAGLKQTLQARVSDPANPTGKRYFYFQLEGMEGENITLDRFKGKFVFVDMWATWCGPCKAQVPYLIELEKALHGRDIEFLSISADKPADKEKWKEMVAELGMGGTHAISPDAFNYELFKTYQVTGIPRFMLISPEGTLLINHSRRPSDPVLKKQLEELLDDYDKVKTQLAVRGAKPGSSFSWVKPGSMSTILASHKAQGEAFHDNTVLTQPTFLSINLSERSAEGRFISLYSGNALFMPGGRLTLTLNPEGKAVYSGDKAELNQMMESIRVAYQSRYPFINRETVLNKKISEQLVALYTEIEAEITKSALSDEDKKILIGYYQGDLFNRMYNTIITSKVFGKSAPRPTVAKNYSQPVLGLNLVPEIAWHYNWGSTIQEFLYARLAAGKVKIGSKESYVADMAAGLTNPATRELYVVYYLERELLMAYTVGLAERVNRALPLVKDPDNRKRLDRVIAGIPAAQRRYAGGLPGTDLSAYSFKDAKGNSVSLGDFKGRYVFIDLWSTGCNPCIGEIPYIKDMEHRFARKPIVWVSISLDNREEVWSEFLVKEKMTGIQLLCENGFDNPFIRQIGLSGIPRFLILDKAGKVIDHHTLRPSNPVLGELLQLMMK